MVVTCKVADPKANWSTPSYDENGARITPPKNTITIEHLGDRCTVSASFVPGCTNAFVLENEAGPLKIFEGNRKAILKMEEPGKASELDQELDTFRILEEYQGQYLPHLYGKVKATKGTEAPTHGILMSHPDGMFLTDMADVPVHKVELERQITLAIRATADKGILNRTIHDYIGAMWVNGTIQFIDWQYVRPFGAREPGITKEQDKEGYIKAVPGGLLSSYSFFLRCAKVNMKKYGYE